jgi:response regulator NasT
MTMAQFQANVSQTPDWNPSLETPPPLPRTILVADDELLVARSIVADLTYLGYEVIGPAPNGVEALAACAQRRPDLALLDIRMPEMDGLAAGAAIHQQFGVPVVILSAFSDPPYVDAAADQLFYGYLLKPTGRDELQVTLRLAWSRYLEDLALRGKVRDLEEKLRQRKIIERAKGVLMKHEHMDEETAMRTLQKRARDARRPMADLAAQLLQQHGITLPS